jgi:hypothetical protein
MNANSRRTRLSRGRSSRLSLTGDTGAVTGPIKGIYLLDLPSVAVSVLLNGYAM